MTDREAAEESGVEGGARLLAFAAALVAGDERELSAARERLRAELGPDFLVEAAAVASNFERMVRIADATGIPLDPMMEAGTRELRDELGIDRWKRGQSTFSVSDD